MAKPEHFPDWATDEQIDEISGQANYVEPPDARKQFGWTRREIPPRQWFNWLARQTWLWLQWIDSVLNRPESFTVATLPSASGRGPGAMVYVSDEVGGAVLAFSDGVNWRRVTDRGVVS